METPNDNLTLRAGLALSGLEMFECWIAYMAIGGAQIFPAYSRAVLDGSLSGQEHDLAAHALNETLNQQGLGHPVAYEDEFVNT